MFSDELEQIDRAMSVDGGFSRYIRSKHANPLDSFKAERMEKNPTAGFVTPNLTPWHEKRAKGKRKA